MTCIFSVSLLSGMMLCVVLVNSWHVFVYLNTLSVSAVFVCWDYSLYVACITCCRAVLDGTAWRWLELSATLVQALLCRLEKSLNRSGNSNCLIWVHSCAVMCSMLQVHVFAGKSLMFLYLCSVKYAFSITDCYVSGRLAASNSLYFSNTFWNHFS